MITIHDEYGFPMTAEGAVDEMIYPMRCLRCQHFHDGAKVTVLQRYTDCSTWRCPKCRSLIDDRPVSWGGSAERFVSRTDRQVDL